MKIIALLLLLFSAALAARDGNVSARDVSLSGIEVGDTPAQVRQELGTPTSTEIQPDYLDLHYRYPQLTVSFNENTVAGLYTDNPASCTPRGLCPGDPISKMRRLYGEPVVADRETGRFYEYYGHDLFCWLKIPADTKTVASISVDCQP